MPPRPLIPIYGAATGKTIVFCDDSYQCWTITDHCLSNYLEPVPPFALLVCQLSRQKRSSDELFKKLHFSIIFFIIFNRLIVLRLNVMKSMELTDIGVLRHMELLVSMCILTFVNICV